MRKTLVAALMLAAAAPAPSWAWGYNGHRIIGELAAKNFPAQIPGFLKTPLAIRQIGVMAQEPDASRGAGQPHDDDSDPGHFLDLGDDGSIFGGPKLSALPASRRDYDTALRAANSNEYAAGFLPYNIMDGYEQLTKDFAILRMNIAGAKFAKNKAARDGYERARAVREILTLRDLGVWGHYIGDASQPLHVTIHYNGWGDGPNPGGYVTGPGLHAKFETAFVDAHVSEADVAAALRPYKDCACTIRVQVQAYLAATAAQMIPVYEFEKAGAFDAATPAAKAFTALRIAEGAAMLRDMVTDAWGASGSAVLGYKNKEVVTDIEAGKADPSKLD